MIQFAPPTRSVGMIGIIVELGSCLLVVMLVVGLRLGTRRRDYLDLWSAACVAVVVAVSAVLVLYALLPAVAAGVPIPATRPWLIPLFAVYQVAKFGYFGFLLLGVMSFVREAPVDRRLRLGVGGGALVLGLGNVLLTRDLNQLVVIQSAVAIPTSLAGLWLLMGLPPARRGPGTVVLSVGLAYQAFQWLIYAVAFSEAGDVVDSVWSQLHASVATHNSYFNAAQLIIIGVGMALSLVEDDHREAEASQTEQVRDATEARERLGEILRAAQEGIVTVKPDRSIDLVNPAAAAILGIDSAAAVGSSFDLFLREDHRAGLWEALATSTRRSEANPPVAIRRETFGVRADGEQFPLELSASSLGGGAGRGWVIVLRDLTEQLRVQDDQERVHSQMAQAARLEAVGRLVSGVAHELNNPLTAIMAFSQDLASTPRAPEEQEILEVIAQQAERCRVIVGDLLIFSRSRREERRRVCPEELTERVARVFAREASRLEVGFEVSYEADLPPIEVDVAGIEQVLTNLLTNAFQATPVGGAVTLRMGAAAGQVRIDVEDTGPGVPAEVLPRIFEPFFTTKGPGDGTGLGLSVSHAIVGQHGGTLTAKNLASGGAQFRIVLPFVDRRIPSIAVDEARQSAESPRSGRLLVVDDEASIRSAVRRAFERRGWAVDEAADGVEGWLRLDLGGRAAEYDVVITDLKMPGLSGVELVDRLRAHHPELADRTIVITGDTASPAVADFMGRLRTPYLQKPFDLRTLVSVVEQLMASTQP